MQQHLEGLLARVSSRVAEQTATDHVEFRLGPLDLKSRCEDHHQGVQRRDKRATRLDGPGGCERR